MLQDIEVFMSMNIAIGRFSALNVDAVREFDVVKIIGDVHTSGKDRVVQVQYWELLTKGGSWYIPTNETGVVWVMHIVNPDISMIGISQNNMLPRGFPQGIPPLSNSPGCRTKQTSEQLKLLDEAKMIPKTTSAQISAEIERRKVLDYEIELDDDEWEQEENNKAITQEDDLLAAIDWNTDSDE